MCRKPSASRAAAVASGSAQYRSKTCCPCTSNSPSSATRTVVPARGGPTVPILTASGRLTAAAAVVSVSPQPSSTGIPAPRKKWPSRAPSGAPPEITHWTSPPERRAEFPKHEHVERGTLQTQVEWDLAVLYRFAGVDRGCGRQREDLALVPVDGLLLRAGIELFEHKGDGEQQRRLESGEVVLQRTRVGAVADRDGRMHQATWISRAKTCASGQEQQCARLAREQRGQALDGACCTEQAGCDG